MESAMKKILVVFGTRPEAIKMAPVVRALKARSNEFETQVCVTAQHRQMLDQVLELFQITPDYDLDIMQDGQDLYDVSSKVLLGMRGVLKECRPDWVLVHGDTTTSFATSLAAFYAGIKVGHVEAGLRTYNLKGPFPEEGNRQLTGRLAELHFAPTEGNRLNLLQEGVHDAQIRVTGNTVIDALLWAKELVGRNGAAFFKTEFGSACEAFESDAPLILVTAHRRENFGDGIRNICLALVEIANRFKLAHIVYPVHPNPNIKNVVESMLGGLRNVHLISPLDYAPFVFAMARANVILTDSGGVQEEAPSLNKRIFVLRSETERPEAVEAGAVELVGADTNRIIQAVGKALDATIHRPALVNPYGDGTAAIAIAETLAGWPE
jgi:UDP-N-acetylglucosamine 2-epimerase (non-hydrolysing)